MTSRIDIHRVADGRNGGVLYSHCKRFSPFRWKMRSCDDRAPDVLLVSALGWSTPFAAVALNRAPSHGTPSTKENVRTGNYPLVGKAAGVSINPFANVAHAFMSKSTGLGFFSATFRQQQRESRKHRHGLPWKHATRKHTYRKCRQRYFIPS